MINTDSNQKGLEWLGGFNTAPPNWKEITEKELAQTTLLGSYTPEHIIYKQILAENNHLLTVKLFVFHDGTGVGLNVDYWGKGYYDEPTLKEPLQHVRWFKFAKCEHVMEHTQRLGNCYNRYVCKKCGYTEDVDSSD